MIRAIQLSTSTWWKVIAFLTILIVVLNTLRPAMGSVEGNLFPVITDVKITRIIANEKERYIDFGGTYNKKRDCDFVGYEWFMTDPDGRGRERFDVFIINDLWRNYALGGHEFGPRRAYVDADNFLAFALGIVVHNCHLLYDTSTVFYQGNKVR